MNGSDALLKKLKENGTDTVFGYPGGVLLPLYDSIYDCDIKHILVRHEQAAAHAADGYARVSGKPGVCIATSGPGATNLVTGIATANIDSSPVIALTGQVTTGIIGTDAFQEVDTIGLTMPITKENFQPRKSCDLPKVIDAAYEIASTGRPGVVVVDLPKDVLEDEVSQEDMKKVFDLPGYKPTTTGNTRQIKRAIEAIVESKKPVIIAGGGVILSNASVELVKFATLTNIPIATTLMGKGSISEDHELSLGHLGMHGLESTNNAVTDCDCLIAIGCRFSDRTTGKVSEFAPNATKIQIDIDPAEIGKNVQIDLPIVGDAKTILRELIVELNETNHAKWTHDVINKHKAYKPKMFFNTTPLKPQETIKEIMEAVTPTTIVSTDVGQNQMWMAHYYKTKNPRTFISSGGLGTMGFGLPAAMGAQVAKPEENVLAVVGDGGFQMVSQELATIKENDLPIVTCILNNRYLGMVSQLQKLFNEHVYATKLTETPDFVKLAEAYGVCGERVEKPGELRETIQNAFKSREATVIDVTIDSEELLPIVPPGCRLDNMKTDFSDLEEEDND